VKCAHSSTAIVLAMLLSTLGARAQEPPQFPKPGPEHDRLKPMAGQWDAKVTAYCTASSSGPERAAGRYTAKLDLGGFFLVTKFKCELAGKQFQGRGLIGYDSFKKKYVGVWVDSMSPAIYHSEGAFDAAGKVYTETMEGPGPDGKPMRMRITTELKDKDHMRFQMFAPDKDGKETLMMEIGYTRSSS
jgi:hypothetical protein